MRRRWGSDGNGEGDGEGDGEEGGDGIAGIAVAGRGEITSFIIYHSFRRGKGDTAGMAKGTAEGTAKGMAMGQRRGAGEQGENATGWRFPEAKSSAQGVGGRSCAPTRNDYATGQGKKENPPLRLVDNTVAKGNSSPAAGMAGAKELQNSAKFS